MKNIVLILTKPIRTLFGFIFRSIIKNIYSREKTLKHDIKSDFRARILNGLHQTLVGIIPQPFLIHHNQLKFYSDGSLMSVQAFYVGEVEYHQMSYLLKNYIKNGMVFLDVGGHHGAFSLIIAHELKGKKYSSKVYTFEPDPRNIEYIRKNLEVNSLNNDVTIVPCAVSDKNGTGKFVMSSDNSCNWLELDSSLPTENTSTENMQMVSIDEYCKDFEKVDVIKMDIQGGELLALKGAESIIKKFRPVLFVEIMDYSSDAIVTKEYLKSLDYELFYLSNSSKLVKEGSQDIFISWDVVAIPNKI